MLNNFQQQVKGIVGLLDELTGVIGEAATAFQKWIRPILVENFGEGVGNRLADGLTLYTDIQVGAVTGLIGTVSGVVAMADPDTWKGMAEMALSVAKDPSTLPGVLANMGKEFVAWDKWSGDHPGRAAGEAAFNIGSLFVPGGALSKTGSVAKGLNLSRHVLEEGRLPRLGELGSWTRGAPNTIEAPHVPEFNPGGAGGVPPLRPEGIPGAGPGAPGTGHAPAGSTPSGGSPSGGGPRPGEPSAPAARPSGAEGGAGPRAPLDAGRGGGDPQPTAAPGIASEQQGGSNGRAGGQPEGSAALAPEGRGESADHGGGNKSDLHTGANAEHANDGTDPHGVGDDRNDGPDHQSPSGPNDDPEPRLATEVFSDANPYGNLTKEQFEEQFVDDRGWFRYPDDTDPAKPYAIPGTVRELSGELLQTQLNGAVLDRIGHPGGAWLAPAGTPYGERALPPDSLQKPYHVYVVHAENPLPVGWTIEESKATPWFGHSGGGLQYRVIAPTGESGSIEELLDSGFLSEVFE